MDAADREGVDAADREGGWVSAGGMSVDATGRDSGSAGAGGKAGGPLGGAGGTAGGPLGGGDASGPLGGGNASGPLGVGGRALTNRASVLLQAVGAVCGCGGAAFAAVPPATADSSSLPNKTVGGAYELSSFNNASSRLRASAPSTLQVGHLQLVTVTSLLAACLSMHSS